MGKKVYPIGGLVKIGYSPEHKAREFLFDIAKYLAMWPDSIPKMLVQRYGDTNTYIANAKLSGTKMTWAVTRYDTYKAGTGNMWIAFYGAEDQQLGLTPATQICVESGPPDVNGYIPPETAIPWVQRVLEAADRVEHALASSPVVSKPTRAEFPEFGSPDAIYKAENEKRLYQWNDAKSCYEPLGMGMPGGHHHCGSKINIIYGGNAVDLDEDDLVCGGDADGTT